MKLHHFMSIVALVWGVLNTIPESGFALTHREKQVRLQIKRAMFGGLAIKQAQRIAAGEAEPIMHLNVHDSLFINWKIPVDARAALVEILDLPAGFRLAPIQILEGEQAGYYLSLNVYQVSVGQTGFRAEWSVYVRTEEDPRPRFMVIQALSNVLAFDPVVGEVPPVDLNYSRKDGIVNVLIDGDQTYFEAQFKEPRPSWSSRRRASPDWAKANDVIYWPNAVADKGYYNGSLTRAWATFIHPKHSMITDGTRWSQFVDDEPMHVFLYQQPLEFAVSPWYNLSDPHLDLEPGHLDFLLAVKAEAFSALARFNAFQVLFGKQEALIDFDVENHIPAYVLHFRVPPKRVRDLAEAIRLPDGFHLAPISVLKHARPEFLVSLKVYQASSPLLGKRTEWFVYVSSDDDPWQRYLMIIDVASDVASLDVVNLFGEPADLFVYEASVGLINTRIENGDSRLKVRFPMPEPCAPRAVISPSWVQAHDRVYWSNGVYDRLLYNATLLDAQVARVDLSEVMIENKTPWRDFVDPRPLEVLVFCDRMEFKLHPWYNLEEIEPSPIKVPGA